MKNYSEKKTDQPMKKLLRINLSWDIRVLLLEKKNKRTLMRDHKLLSNFSILEDTWKFSLLENTVNCTWQYIEIRELIEQYFKRTP